jgi:selenocysteine lyase/cysteine desulfurase
MNKDIVRHDTPGTRQLIHFNNAGAALIPKPIVDGMKDYLDTEASMGGYEAAVHFESELSAFYDQSALLVNANPSEIALTESATVAWQRALHAIPFDKGDIILSCMSEYASNYIAFLQLKKLKDVVIQVIPNDIHGAVDVEELKKAINPKVKLISICHIPTGNGLINPVEEIGEICKTNNILYLLDACQSVGQCPVDVAKINCDFLTATGRKYLRGPRGTGFLYARQSTTEKLEPTYLDLHGAEWISPENYRMRKDAKKFETWESNLSGKYGFTLALKYLNNLGIEEVYKEIKVLSSYLRTRLNEIDHIRVRDTGIHQCGIVTFSSSKYTVNEMKHYLSKRGVNVSVALLSSSLLDLKSRNITEVVRASVHYYNTEGEIDFMINLLAKLKSDGPT